MDPEQVQRDADGRLRCRECGFAYDLDADGVVNVTRNGLALVQEAVAGVPVEARGRRPHPNVWSVNAYTSHLADASRVILERVRAISTEDRPPLAYHDQDRAVEESRADEIPAEESMARLVPAVEEFTETVSTLPEGAWRRVGVHARAGDVRLAEVAHDMPHELQHHAMDIRRVGQEVTGA